MASSLERFETLQIKRSEIKNAPYNPRTITESAKRKLRAGIKKLGILAPIVWNKRTGNIVSGHQRMNILDQITPKEERIDDGKDYMVTVSAVDLNDIDEKSANLLFNNAAAQGDFDVEKVSGILTTPGMDIEATGWDATDMYRILGHDNMLAEQQGPAAGEDLGDNSAPAAALEEMRKSIKDFDRRTKERRAEGLSDYFLVLVFPTYAERKRWTDHLHLDDNRYQAAKDVGPALVEYGWPDDDDDGGAA